MDAARGEECEIRVPNECNRDTSTTVLAHYRLAGLCGMAIKPMAILGAHACSRCHDIVDFRVRITSYIRPEIRLMHADGVLRTIDKLIRTGKVKVT